VAALLFGTVGFGLGWPMEWLIQRYPRRLRSPPSARRRLVLATVTALLVAALALRIGFEPRLAPALLLTALVVPASVIDVYHRIIPNLINYPGTLLVLAAAAVAEPGRSVEFVVGALGCGLFLGLASLLSPKGMGLGDVKMSLMIGAGTGRYAAVALLAGFGASAVVAGYLVVRHGSAALKWSVPFGPFLAFGAEVGLMWGPGISRFLF
jgi:leader peptidase (prepilin peptidase)/N-methyltransferase